MAKSHSAKNPGPAMPAQAFPVPIGAERGVYRPPNLHPELRQRGGARNSYLPLSGGTDPTRPPNLRRDADGDGDFRRDGSADLMRRESGQVKPPNHQFEVGMSKMPQPQSAVTPGGSTPIRGAINVNPFTGSGNAAVPGVLERGE